MSASGNKPRRRSYCCWTLRLLCSLIALLPTAHAATPGEVHRVQDLYYGQALYQYFQQQELAAITQLMTAAERPRRATSQVDEANLLLADLFYSYGLYEESRAIFAQLLNAEVSASIQNRIWFNLAQLRYQQGYYGQVGDLLSRINDRLPAKNEAERKYLQTALAIGEQQYDQAAEFSRQIDPDSIWKTYARYNLGVALLEKDNYQRGSKLLDELGQMKPENSEQLALRDLANLSLGLKQLRLGENEPALQSLSRIRLEGPLSNQALLASGWAWYALQQFDKALVPWRLLLERNATDAPTQEAILAIPANYARSGEDQLAIRYYKIAANQFELQLASLDNAIDSIEQGELISALRETALLHDRSHLQRMPPISAVTPQLHLLLASNEFHRQLKRYQELLDIRQSLGYWGTSFPALELMLDERRQAFVEKLPMLMASSSFDQFEIYSSRRDDFAARVATVESSEDHQALATPTEEEHFERLQRVSASIDKVGTQRNTSYQQDMLRLLSGMLNYELATDYPRRIWKARKQLKQLDRAFNETQHRIVALRQITERSELDFAEYQGRISGQSDKIAGLRRRVDGLLLQQEQHINQLGIGAIRAQQQHVQTLRLNARFELARIYDKLTSTQ